jgi:hypothetical protein
VVAVVHSTIPAELVAQAAVVMQETQIAQILKQVAMVVQILVAVVAAEAQAVLHLSE